MTRIKSVHEIGLKTWALQPCSAEEIPHEKIAPYFAPVFALCAVAVIGAFDPAAARVSAPETPGTQTMAPLSATATFKATKIAIGVGYTWGEGVLTYKGRTYPFKVKGISALGIGASTIDGTAEVFNLKKLEDFSGVYGAASAGATVGPIGAGTGGLTNRKGVEMRLNTQSEGLELSLAVSGVTIELEPR